MKRNFGALFFFTVFLFFPYGFAESWYVCVGSFVVEKNAGKLYEELQEAGFLSFIEPVILQSGSQVYRVMIGEPQEFPVDARTRRDEFSKSDFAKKKNIFDAWICQAPVHSAELSRPSLELEKPKSNASVKKAEDTILEKNDAVPLSKETPYSLLVQTYKEEQTAENDRNRLVSHGLDAYVLRKYNDDTSLSFDLHAGVAATEAELAPVEEKLSDLNIPGVKVMDYNDFSEDLQRYDELVQEQPVVFGGGIDVFPESISENVRLCLDQFPINKDFGIESIEIFDVDNIKKKSMAYGEELFDSVVGEGIFNSVSAFSFAVYKDDLFNKSLSIFIAVSDIPVFEIPSLVPENKTDGGKKDFDALEGDGKDTGGYKENEIEREMDFLLKYGVLKSVILKDEAGYVLKGVTEDKKLFLMMSLPNFTSDETLAFLDNYSSDSSLLVYPQIRRTFCIFPEDTERDFLCYSLKKIGMDYVESKGHADWAIKILGHWNADFTFDQFGESVEIGIFDLDYDYNAMNAHTLFRAAHNKNFIGKDNHPEMVNGTEGWYLLNYNGGELSFPTKSYIIAIDVDVNSYLKADELNEIAGELKIWD